jgi:tRNA1Val (adenine37-N6)-methyltransferase
MPDDRPLPADDETLDRLADDWFIFQLSKGHRFSTDDLAVAWRASRLRPDVDRMLDIGSGLGSVGLSTLSRLNNPNATLIGVEAQDRSVALARKSAAWNGLTHRVRFEQADLREAPGTVLAGEAKFPLITGSPPYVPIGKGVISSHPQKAACRFELRGSCEDYCKAAAQLLEPDGLFVYVMAAADPRAEAAPGKAGLRIVERWDFVFRADQPPLVATFACVPEASTAWPRERATGRLVIRGADGEWTPEYDLFRGDMGVLHVPEGAVKRRKNARPPESAGEPPPA